ncbi:hypothetical protein P4133_21460 [Pseudomonas aeruginosa]|nr:hypothetical protein [Pseudomonas aeruginosa]
MPKPLVGIVAGITPNIDALELNQDISLAQSRPRPGPASTRRISR